MHHLYKIGFTGLIASLLLSTCSQNKPTEQSNKLIISNGLLRIEVLPGSYATTNCGMDMKEAEITNYACVAFPFASKHVEGKNWDADYLKALDANGWKWAGGEGNAYYLEKVATSECNHSLAMIGWLQGTKEQVKTYFDTGELGEIENQTYIFALEDKQKCGDERNAK